MYFVCFFLNIMTESLLNKTEIITKQNAFFFRIYTAFIKTYPKEFPIGQSNPFPPFGIWSERGPFYSFYYFQKIYSKFPVYKIRKISTKFCRVFFSVLHLQNPVLQFKIY